MTSHLSIKKADFSPLTKIFKCSNNFSSIDKFSSSQKIGHRFSPHRYSRSEKLTTPARCTKNENLL